MAIQQLLQSKQGGIPPQMMALLELEQAKQALMQSGVAPGTVAGQKVQEAQMLTQPPQQPGMEDLMPGVQQRAGEMAQAQQPVTQAQLRQAMAQQTQQSQQPVMAAEGGIITLPADIEMAEGGIVGYNGESESQVRSPEEVETQTNQEAWLRKKLQDIKDALRGKGTVYDFSTAAPQVETPAATPTNQDDVSALVAAAFSQPRQDQPLRGTAPSPAPSPRPPAAPAAAPAASGVSSPLQQYQTAGEAAIQRALAPLLEAKKERKLTPEEEAFVKRQEENLLRSRERLTEQERRFLDLERQREEVGKTTGLQDLAAFLSRVKGRTLAAGLGNAALGMEPIEAERRKEKQASIDRKRQYFDLLEDRKDAIEQRDLAIQQGRMDRARAEQDRIDAVNRALAQTTGTLEAQRMQGLSSLLVAEMNRKAQAEMRNLPNYEQQNAERAIKDWLAKNPGKTFSDAWEWFRGAGKPDRTVMTYDQAADNVSKFLDTTAGIMEISAIRKRVKDAGQPEPSLSQIREILIQRELQGAGGKTAPALGNQAAPPVGTVMQGYRFKGGNPADRNNWEKV